jgi:DNA replication ATP-dependent helicase Dna2
LGNTNTDIEKIGKSYVDFILNLYKNGQIPLKDKYNELYRIFNEIVNDQTTDCGIDFAGPFARMSFVCKKYNISHENYQLINTLRIHCREFETFDSKELEEYFPYDVKTLIEFIGIIFYMQIPFPVIQLFPIQKKDTKRTKITSNYIRVYVNRWDNQFIYGTTSDINGEYIVIDYMSNTNFGDWSYLNTILTNNTQLNIVFSKIENGIYYPELIIFEPDYLIDISSIANCFTQYGNTAYNYLLRKVMPNPNSSSILLGNLASQFLDELINDDSNEVPSYAKIIKKFFEQNALDIATCEDMTEDFHRKASNQLRNLAIIIRDKFTELPGLKLEQLILEPSFFCEILGIQGRMDLLQSDMKILMEQKSGKRAFGSNMHLEPHYVQMLLYLALLHYNYQLKNEDISCYLLYSKYIDGLIRESSAPKLLFEAIKIRNQIVKGEYYYAEGNVANVFEALSPERLNSKQLTGRLWSEYQYPSLATILNTIHNASELEKAYFYRFFTFVEKEQMLSKIGSPKKEASGFASIWNATVEEKKQTGDIYDNLIIRDKLSSAKGIGYDTVLLQMSQQEINILSNFRIGDIIILYAYSIGKTPNATQTIVIRGAIKDISNDLITIMLRHPQRNTLLFDKDEKWKWAIEHDHIDSSFSSLYRSLFTFLIANKDRRDLLLNRRRPTVDKEVKLNGDYGEFNECVLKAKQSADYFLLIGPPGTGKTSFGLINILKEELTEPNSSTLLAAYTNRAVDEICSKLRKNDIPFIRLGSVLSCDKTYVNDLLNNRVKSCRNSAEIKEIIASARVMVGTTSAFTSNINLFNIKNFSLAIIDEASQILEPQLLSLFCSNKNGINSIKRFVLIGDYKQLPAVVQQNETDSKVEDEKLIEIGLTDCRNSLFERLIKLQQDNDDASYLLIKQGRMHPDISEFPNKTFYEGKLRPIPLAHQISDILYRIYDESNKLECRLVQNRVIFIPSLPYETLNVKVNINEARIIASVIYSIRNLYKENNIPFDPDQTIGVIVPYRNQISMIRQEIDKYKMPELHDITIDTVERYQGSERDIIIFGFTIHQNYQLDFLTSNILIEKGRIIDRRLNVALTRARQQIILTGNESILRNDSIYSQLIDFIKDKKGYFIDKQIN